MFFNKENYVFSTDGVTLTWGTPEDIVYHRKPTTPGLRAETEDAGAAISVTKVTPAAVRCTNACLQADGHHCEHLL